MLYIQLHSIQLRKQNKVFFKIILGLCLCFRFERVFIFCCQGKNLQIGSFLAFSYFVRYYLLLLIHNFIQLFLFVCFVFVLEHILVGFTVILNYPHILTDIHIHCIIIIKLIINIILYYKHYFIIIMYKLFTT